MKYLKLSFIPILLMLLSCESSELDNDVKPSDLLTEQQMIDVLIDLHITESALTLKNFSRDSSLVLFHCYEQEIFKNKKITEAQFQNSYTYYSQHSAEIDKIYEKVIDSLSVKESTGNIK